MGGQQKKRGTTSNRRNRNPTTITTANYKDQRWEQKQQVQHLRNTTITTIITTISSNNIEHEPYSLSFNDSRQVSQIELRLCIIAWRRDLGPESCTSWIWTREDGKLIKNILKQPSHAKYYNLESHQLTHTTQAKSCNLSKSCFQWSRQATTYSPGCPWPDVFLPPQPLLCPGDWKSIGNLKPWHLLQRSKDGELSKIKMLMVLWSCDWILSPTLAERYLDSAVVARWILDTKWRWKSSHQVIKSFSSTWALQFAVCCFHPGSVWKETAAIPAAAPPRKGSLIKLPIWWYMSSYIT